MIQEAHESGDNQPSSTDNATPCTMDSSFFLGEDEGQPDEEEYTPPESEQDEGTNSSRSNEDSNYDSQGVRLQFTTFNQFGRRIRSF